MIDLSKRHAEIIQRVARGEPDKAIAYELGISVHTVRTHLERIAAKLPPGETPRRHRMILFFLTVESGPDPL